MLKLIQEAQKLQIRADPDQEDWITHDVATTYLQNILSNEANTLLLSYYLPVPLISEKPPKRLTSKFWHLAPAGITGECRRTTIFLKIFILMTEV